MTPALRLVSTALLGASLAACGTIERLENVGRVPDLSPISNPADAPIARTAVLPVEPVVVPQAAPGSLWRHTGARTFFNDQRARRPGDILTVVIDITDEAQVENTTSRSRANKEGAGLPSFLGLESGLSDFLPSAVDPASLVDASSSSSSSGTGKVDRKEEISLTVAAVVTRVLPNGNLVVQGSQEVRVNYEVRELLVTGVVRPEDIKSDNTINHTQIAEARISYGGRGQLTDVQQPRYGQQVFDALFPF